MNKSESIAELAKALAQFQKEVKQPSKAGVNPHFKSKYVTLDDTIKAINDTAPKHGLSYIQTPINDEHGIGVVTVILHESGQYIEFPNFTLPIDKKTAQGAGSALTYARRYSISSAFGLVSEEDDDANAAMPQKQSQSSTEPKASDKQLNFINKLITDNAKAYGKTNEVVYTKTKEDLKITNELETVTNNEAKKIINYLQETLNKKTA